MKTIEQLKSILSDCRAVDCHVHTHLCDGKSNMTVENIAHHAYNKGLELIILTPHFHKRLSDASDTLYEDSDESILLALREEIDYYEKTDGKIKFLLSTEADILSLDGHSSLDISVSAENALDLVSLTLNHHPLLPLKFVKLTYGKYVNSLHESGEYLRAASKRGGVEGILKAMYETQINAIEQCQYPAMLGHFFMAHGVHPDTYNCFGAGAEHLALMKDGARRVIETCRRKNVMMDLTGVHMRADESVLERIARNGFLVDFQCFVIQECLRLQVPFYFGSDAHSLNSIGSARMYYDHILQSVRADSEN